MLYATNHGRADPAPNASPHSRHSRLSQSALTLILLLAACGEQEPPTAPAGEAQPDAAVTAAALRVVNSLADPGTGVCNATECTLREAIEDPASTRIGFASGLTGTITLASPTRGGGSLVIDKALTITGPAAGIVIRRRPTDPEFRIMRIGKAGVVTLKNLTLRGGMTALQGGGILNYGTLELTNVQVVGNTSTKGAGGIDNRGPLTVINSGIVGNTGAGIYNHDGGSATISNSTVSRNSGGISGLGDLAIHHSAITYNASSGLLVRWGTVALDNVRIVSNGTSGSGVGIGLAITRMTVANSVIASNAGDGIDNGLHGFLTVVNSAIIRNQGNGITSEAHGRAGVSIAVTNSTISRNSGDGISNADDVEAGAGADIVNSTVTLNGGHGIHQRGINGAVLTLSNSLVAGNLALVAPDVYNSNPDGGSVAASYSLIGDGTGSGIANEDGNQVGNVPPYTSPINPLLGPLTNNGGLTPTHALLIGSPALDAGTSQGCPATDQRGVTRPQGLGCDIGSFEREVP